MTGEPAVIEILAGRTGVVLAVGDDGRLHQIAFGLDVTGRRPDLPVVLYPLAYPTFGEEILREPALQVTHVDGATSTRLRFASASTTDHEHGTDHRIDLVDRVAALAVTLCFRTWPDHHVLEQWVEVVNHGDGDTTVHQAAASAPALAGSAPTLTHWGGGWANEWQETTERLHVGTKTVASAGGVRPSLHRPPIVLLAPDGAVGETEGLVGAVTLAWGGDCRFDAEVAPHDQLRLIAGQQHRGAARVLGPGERFATAHAYWTWSDAGRGGTSRALHRFARQHLVRGGTEVRATVANTWEAMFFDLSDAALAEQVDRAAEIGAELFLLDDGWFGDRYPRNDDTTSLGDWDVDRSKLPAGLAPLIARTVAAGMRFGLWVEPEMVNPVSERHEAHPGWAIGEPGREARQERNQLVLDVLQPEVRAFVADVVDRVLADHPDISYLKWDANRDVTEPGSPALPAGRQSHLPIDRVAATWAVMAGIAERHPQVELMACASGGGRSDLGTLRWFHEVWTSDDTDPVDRVRIQWGASHLLPAGVLGAHVTRWNARPVPFGCAVALSGRFGFDLDLRSLTDDERAVCADAAATYRAVRDLVQQGDLHRLASPVGGTRAALAHVSPDGTRAVVFAYRLPGDVLDAAGPGIDLTFLPPDATVEVRDRTPGRAGTPTLAPFTGREAGEDVAVARRRLDEELDRDLAWVPLAGRSRPWPISEAPSASVHELRISR